MPYTPFTCWLTDENECGRLHNSVSFRLRNESLSVCQTGIRSYIRSCVHQHWWATGNLFVTVLFTSHTADCRNTHDECQTDKFADDTAQLGQITDDDDRRYLQAITNFVQWCNDNFLELNVEKTKDMITDFRSKKKKKKTQSNSVVIKRVDIDRVSTYEYLGVVFDSSLN